MRRRAGIEREFASRADQRVLRWFGHVERMDVYRMARRVLMAEVSGGRVRGRPRLGWMVLPGGSGWIISVGDYADNSFAALGSSDPREVRLEL